jgi:thioredoxin-related protein
MIQFLKKPDIKEKRVALALRVIWIAWLFAFTTSTAAFAQEDVGIKFQQGLSWSAILDKAKKENKYIFLDGYTTWCVPCKQMAKEIFPQEEVGTFFNQNFINVAVQFDETSSDNAEVENWYADAKKIEAAYSVESYPTYLYFNPNGDLVQTLNFGSMDAKEFVEKSKLALDPTTQYGTLKRQYQSGNRDSTFLANIVAMALSLREPDSLTYYAADYLKLQKDLTNENNIKIIATATRRTSDIGFPILRNHPKLVDSIMGPGFSTRTVKYIVSEDIIRPMTRSNLTVTEYPGGMRVYGGAIIPNVDWQLAKTKLDVDYADISEEVLRRAKLAHFEELKDWKQYVQVVESWRKQANIGPLERDDLYGYTRSIFQQVEDKDAWSTALKWSIQNLKADPSNPDYRLIYYKLLYKTGRHKAALKKMSDFVKTDSPFQAEGLNALKKMKRGEVI